ncbi:dCMP deaminase [Malassezia yamatoensis]|uniref:Ubiquitin-like modifier-activating enzyme ATG7 n=1 Tax=Malassezia yamatoensis TaxID=253288 RepID=A0AAJ5YV05_9BASI|nr:dCMP deaminase [Malassezia yamatoensis]
MARAQFTSFVSQVTPSFWNTFSALKLDELRLDDDFFRVHAEYGPSKTTRDRITGSHIGSGCRIRLQGDGIMGDELDSNLTLNTQHDTDSKQVSRVSRMPGYVKNFNTLQEFKDANKLQYFYHVVDDIWDAMTQPTNAKTLATINNPNCFLLLTYADLKAYKYYYWFAFPALLTQAPAWELVSKESPWQLAQDRFSASVLIFIMQALHDASETAACFVSYQDDRPSLHSLSDGQAYLDETPPEHRMLLFIDPSPHLQHPGWPLRNILTCINLRYGINRIPVLCWRDLYDANRVVLADDQARRRTWNSTYGILQLPDSTEHGVVWQGRNTHLVARNGTQRPDAVGWERNMQGKLGPKLVSLSAMQDPIYLAERAVDLNLKLMRWRVMPELALDTIQNVDVLIIGAGTLGCHVARTLLGWGLRTITLVDNGRVSYSNPVRQPLYTLEDCKNGGRWKAHAAAEALQQISPGVNATGHVVSIPMPGHMVPMSSVTATRGAIADLDRLVKQHDVVFILTDSREARWLPTVLGAVYNKLVINAALGFDSYVLMRHGIHSPEQNPRLGCYFCNDLAAPTNSLSNRTLDQLCTVTRPGLAGIAANTAVELMVSVLQHPLGAASPGPLAKNNEDHDSQDQVGRTELGIVPQQIRGSLATFETLVMSNYAYEHCAACSEHVTEAYEHSEQDFVLDACNDPKFLESVSQLDTLKQELDKLDFSLDCEANSGESD